MIQGFFYEWPMKILYFNKNLDNTMNFDYFSRISVTVNLTKINKLKSIDMFNMVYIKYQQFACL